MSVSFSLLDSLEQFLDSLRYDVMLSIIIGSILLCIICIINKKLGKILVVSVNLILIFLILRYYGKDIVSFKFSNPINNIYFYFFNCIIFMIIYSTLCLLDKIRRYDYLFYSLFLILISFSLFMTGYLKNIKEIVIYNIYPMILFGNILIFMYYIVVLTKIIYHVIIKTTLKGVK